MTDDPVGKAVAAVEAQPEPQPVFSGNMSFEGGRVGVIHLPADLTPVEMIGVIAFVSGEVAARIRALQEEQANPASGLLVPVRPKILLPD